MTTSKIMLLRLMPACLWCIVWIISGPVVGASAVAQHIQSLVPSQRQANPVTDDARKIFQLIEKGIMTGDISLFADRFAGQVQLNLKGDQSGYFSARQAYYILDSHFRNWRAANFHFSTIADSEAAPYATGSGTFVRKGVREFAQVYVLLGSSGDRWNIAQVNIY
jgi:hypothetical protein